MARVYEDITSTVGNTPLVRLRRLADTDTTVLAKVESFNPCGSGKDRIAVSMVDAAEREGLIGKGTVLIEPTSGNTGIGPAFVCAWRGYKLVLTMPESMSAERCKLLQMLGAEIVLISAAMGMSGAVAEAERLSREIPDAIVHQQFKNPANPEAHRRTTALEIWDDTDGQVDVFVAGVGTGGTITGCGEVLKDRNPAIQIVAVEPAGAAAWAAC